MCTMCNDTQVVMIQGKHGLETVPCKCLYPNIHDCALGHTLIQYRAPTCPLCSSNNLRDSMIREFAKTLEMYCEELRKWRGLSRTPVQQKQDDAAKVIEDDRRTKVEGS